MIQTSIIEDDFSIQVFTNSYRSIFTKKAAGNFSFQQKYFSEEFTSKSRLEFFNRYKIPLYNIYNPILEHDYKFYVAKKPNDISAHLPESQVGLGDAVLVLNKKIYGMITYADCIPLSLFHLSKEACASIHLGSRSIIKDVITFLLDKWANEYQLNKENWFGIIGPSIFPENYEIKDDFYQYINEQNKDLLQFVYKDSKSMFFDSRKGLIYQLNKNKISNILTLDFNTFSDPRFSSYRKEKPNHLTQALIVSFN